jgi:hypothetical protein
MVAPGDAVLVCALLLLLAMSADLSSCQARGKLERALATVTPEALTGSRPSWPAGGVGDALCRLVVRGNLLSHKYAEKCPSGHMRCFKMILTMSTPIAEVNAASLSVLAVAPLDLGCNPDRIALKGCGGY